MEFDFTKEPGRVRNDLYTCDGRDVLISVITPFYNAGKYFEQTFFSVMNQTFPWYEWIIVNDGSTNQNDVEILHKLAKSDARVNVITQKNGGLSCARNTGIANSRTELIVPLDADDVIAPTYLECLYWGLYYNPQAAWAYTSSLGFQDQEYVWKVHFDAERLKTYNFLNYSAMIRKADALEIGGYKVEKWAYYEDWRFWLEMLGKSKQPVHIASCLFWYRRLSNGMLSTINKDPERVNFCEQIIQTAAQQADGSVQAVEYPLPKSEIPFYAPGFVRWELKTYKEHKKIRVLWLIPWMTLGGADKFNLDAIAGMKRRGIDSFIVTTQRGDNSWRQKFEDYTDEIYCLADFLDPTHYIEFISYFIQSREIDAVMTSNSYDGYYMLPWLRKNFPGLVMVDYVHMEEWYWRRGGYARISGALGGILERTYVCNSATRQVMLESFHRKAEDVRTVHIGVDHRHFSKEAEDTGYLHRRLNLEEQRPIVLFPCRIHPQKRPFLMLEIAANVREQIPDIVFVVAGAGDQLQELQNAVMERGLANTVYCIGSTDDMRACYRDSRLTLICSLKEGLSLTAYESLSMGVPVVSSDVGGQRDLIGPDVGALIPVSQEENRDFDCREFPEEEVCRYVGSIVRILRDERLYDELSGKCREKIENGFSIENMADQLCLELQELCTDEEAGKRRRKMSETLEGLQGLSADYFTIYQQWKIKDDECEAVWRERCWFEQKWKEERGKRLVSIIRERIPEKLADYRERFFKRKE